MRLNVTVFACLDIQIGSAIAINLLSGIPLVGMYKTQSTALIGCAIVLFVICSMLDEHVHRFLAGVAITVVDVMVILLLQQKNFRYLEIMIVMLTFTISFCFVYELSIAGPDWAGVFGGLVPRPEIVTNPKMLYIAIGILGATGNKQLKYHNRRWQIMIQSLSPFMHMC